MIDTMDVKSYFGFTQGEICEIISCLRERAKVLRYRIAEDNLLLIMKSNIRMDDHDVVSLRVEYNQRTLDVCENIIRQLSAAQISNTTPFINGNENKEK